MSAVGLVLHDRIRLTVTGGTERDVRMVVRASGASAAVSDHRPDIEIHFTERPNNNLPWRHMGQHDSLAVEDRFAIVTTDVTAPIEVALPGEAGGPVRLTYPSGIRTRLPLLRSLINRLSVEKQLLGIHATAFTWSGKGYLACGWPRGGKTGMLLAYLLQGAEYLSAEWVYAGPEQGVMYGVPEPIRLRDWHLQQGAYLLDKVRRRDRWRLWATRQAAQATAGVARATAVLSPLLGKSLRKLAATLDRRRFIDRSAVAWLGKELYPRSAALDTILFVGTHAAPEIRVTPLSCAAAKRRLLALQDEDGSDLTAIYRRWAYAMDTPAGCPACFEQQRSALLDRLLEGKTILAVDHPHNVNLSDLFQTLESSLK